MNEELTDLAWDDLTRATEHLYVAALRFARAFKRDEIDHIHGRGLPVGAAAAKLADASQRHSAAYDRAVDAGCFDDDAEAAA